MNRFDLSHDVKFSTNPGRLCPTLVEECLPGDVWSIAATDFVRFLPLRSPVMHRFRGSRYTFFVPNRILWAGFPDWIFDADASDENPYVVIDDVVEAGSLADYMGIPLGDYSAPGQDFRVNLLPFAAYAWIYDEFFKQQFVDPTDYKLPIVPGDNTATWITYILGQVPVAAWEKDYFTTCLPFPQDSATGVQIPLTFQDDIPVEFSPGTSAGALAVNPTTGAPITTGSLAASGPDGVILTGVSPTAFDPDGSLVVDVQSDAALITDLRRAFRLQEFLEKIITGGKRYIETLMTIFGVRSSDARLQRPEYISGSKFNITVSEVLATTDMDTQSLGEMGGHGISVSGTDSVTYRCEEHGWLISLFVIRPDTAYQDGLHRKFSRTNPLDYAIPDFALIGEQPVYSKELQLDQSAVSREYIFGYQKRYSEYMYAPSRVAGEMRTSLAFWHNGRIFDTFATPPDLTIEFIECRPRLDIFAVTDENVDHIIVQTLNHNSCLRKLPRHAIPTI